MVSAVVAAALMQQAHLLLQAALVTVVTVLRHQSVDRRSLTLVAVEVEQILAHHQLLVELVVLEAVAQEVMVLVGKSMEPLEQRTLAVVAVELAT